MNRAQKIQRLRAMADGWRGVRGRVSLARGDAALIGELVDDFEPGTGDVALVPAEQFVAAVDRIPAGDGEPPAAAKKPARKKKDGDTGGDEPPEDPPADGDDDPTEGESSDSDSEAAPKKKTSRKR